MKLPATSSVHDLESLNRDLETLVLQFHSVTELVRRTQALHDPQRILEEVTASIQSELAFERVGIWTWEAESRSFIGSHGAGISPELIRNLRISFEPVLPLVAAAIHDGRFARLPPDRSGPLEREIYSALAEEPSECILVPLQSRGQNRCFRLRRDPRGCPKAEQGPVGGLSVRMNDEQVRAICLGCPVFPIAGFLWADRGQTGKPLKEDLLPLWFYLAQADLLLEATMLYEELREAAFRDPLTGVHNRGYFFRFLDLEIDRAIRYGHETAVVMIGMDGFKQINQRYGNTKGDELLSRVADICRRCIRRIDLLARYGGDEFVLVLPHTGAREAMAVVERLRPLLVSVVAEAAAAPAGLSFSAGIAVLPKHSPEAQGLAGLAEYAMHQGKQAGGGRTVLFGERS